MKKIIYFILMAILATILIIAVIMSFNPMRRTKKQIINNMLKLTPIGMSMEDVIKTIKKNPKWKIRDIDQYYGYKMNGDTPSGATSLDNEDVVGVKSIRVYLGSYRNLFETSVTIYFAFDKESKLIDMAVWKDTDAL